MAVPNSKSTLKEYCLRALGKPVIEINVDDDQVDDRIDEALQYFSQYHYDGVERMYMKYQVTADDITRARANETVGTGTEGLVSNTFSNQKNFIVMPSAVLSVMNIFNFNDKSNLNMFDIRYQMRLNDLYDFSFASKDSLKEINNKKVPLVEFDACNFSQDSSTKFKICLPANYK